MTFEAVIPQMIPLDVSTKICLGVEGLVAREGVLFKVARRRGPSAGVADAEVESLAVYLHISGL